MRNVILNMYMLLEQLKIKNVRAWGLLSTPCWEPCSVRGWLCWLSPMSNVCLHNAKVVWNVCHVWQWQQTASKPLMPELIHGQVQLVRLPQLWVIDWWTPLLLPQGVGEVPVTGLLWKQPSHEPKGWVTGLCYLQKDTLDRQVQDLCNSFLPDK